MVEHKHEYDRQLSTATLVCKICGIEAYYCTSCANKGIWTEFKKEKGRNLHIGHMHKIQSVIATEQELIEKQKQIESQLKDIQRKREAAEAKQYSLSDVIVRINTMNENIDELRIILVGITRRLDGASEKDIDGLKETDKLFNKKFEQKQ